MTHREKLYLAGPMTGIPGFNFPAFDAMAAKLRTLVLEPGVNVEVVSPAELDDPRARRVAMASKDGDPAEYARLTGMSWGDFLSRDVKLIADGGFTGIVTLPGWERSRGARLETFVGSLVGLHLLRVEYTYDGRPMLVELPRIDLFRAWTAEPNLSIHPVGFNLAAGMKG